MNIKCAGLNIQSGRFNIVSADFNIQSATYNIQNHVLTVENCITSSESMFIVVGDTSAPLSTHTTTAKMGVVIEAKTNSGEKILFIAGFRFVRHEIRCGVYLLNILQRFFYPLLKDIKPHRGDSLVENKIQSLKAL